MTRKGNMAEVLVKALSSKTTQTGKTMYVLEVQDGTKYNLFSETQARTALGALENNLPIDLETKQNGEYVNVSSVQAECDPSENPIPVFVAPVRSGGGGGFGKADPHKMSSIEAQSAMKNAVELCGQGKIEIALLLPTADKIYGWLHDKSK